MRTLAIRVAALVLLACSASIASAQAVSPTESKPDDLAPNTPKSAIRVWADQIGYRTNGQKLLVVSSGSAITDGLSLELVDAKTLKSAWKLVDHKDALKPFNDGKIDGESKEYLAHLDLSDFKTPGRYYVKINPAGADEKPARSYMFNIGDDVYRGAALAAWKSLYFQRADCEKPAKYAGVWADAADHLGAGQAKEAKLWKWTGAQHWDPVGKEIVDETPHDVTGSWWDAGNFDKYIGNTTVCLTHLMLAYQMVGDVAKDGELNIPESGNKVPDLLDEIRYSTDWYIRMADDTGATWGRVYEKPTCPASKDTSPVMLTEQTAGATMNRAAILAYSAVVWKDSKLDDKYAQKCLDEAKKSWTLLQTKPFPWTPDPKDATKEKYTGNWYTVDYKYSRALAAACFFHLTGDAQYDNIVKEYAAGWKAWNPGDGTDMLSIVWVYSHSKGADAEAVANMKKVVLASADKVVKMCGTNRGYAAGVTGYYWSSNRLVGQTGLMPAVASEMTDDNDAKQTYINAAENYVHYLLGRNPVGLCYLTNLKELGAERSSMIMFHTWFGNPSLRNDPFGKKFIGEGEGRIGPPPGYVVGGPNGGIKSYRDTLDGNCWEFNEPCLSYQGPVNALLAYFAYKVK